MLWKRPFLILILLLAWLVLWKSGTKAQESQEPTPPATPIMKPTPTIDRLAPPPTVTSPTQADDGAYLYWLNCQPCHGDRGQGLTDEWRAQYPEEDQYCWDSGCHGKRPYEEGFTLPDTVPALIGDGSLGKFQTLGQLYAYIRTAMPYEYPGALPDEEYLAITAFLARAHDKWHGTTLTKDNINDMWLQPTPLTTPTPSPTTTPTPAPTAVRPFAQGPSLNLAAGMVGLLLFAGVIWIWRRQTL